MAGNQPKYDWSPERVKQVLAIMASGGSMSGAARAIGVTPGALDGYLRRRREASRPKGALGNFQSPPPFVPDNRSLTGRLMGDPPKGRSAADVKKAAEVWKKKLASGVGWF